MIERCWDGVVVGDDAIYRAISRLRKLTERFPGAFRLETAPRIGSRLVRLEPAPIAPAVVSDANGVRAALPKGAAMPGRKGWSELAAGLAVFVAVAGLTGAYVGREQKKPQAGAVLLPPAALGAMIASSAGAAGYSFRYRPHELATDGGRAALMSRLEQSAERRYGGPGRQALYARENQQRCITGIIINVADQIDDQRFTALLTDERMLAQF